MMPLVPNSDRVKNYLSIMGDNTRSVDQIGTNKINNELGRAELC